MLYLNKDTINTYIAELTSVSTLLNPFYLFEMISDFDQEDITLFNVTDLSSYKGRYNRFEIEEVAKVDEDLTNAKVYLGTGSYKLNVYESTIKTLDKNLTTGKVIFVAKGFVNGVDESIDSIYR